MKNRYSSQGVSQESANGDDSKKNRSGSSAPTRYDAFEHLRRALFWELDDLMFAHTAYFDDSGKKETAILLVGGYIATVREWDSFTADWRISLARKGIKEFKRAKFNAREIGDWPDPERDHFLAELASVIHQYTKHAFSTHVSIPDWKRANVKYKMTEHHLYPYPLCARTCMKLARDWCDENGYDKQQVEYVFDKGSEHSGHLIELLKMDGDPYLRRLAPVPADSNKVRPVQAADYFAWEIRHQALINPDPDPSEAERTLRRLLRFPDAKAKIGGYDFDRLDEMCAAMHVPRR